MKSLSSVGIGLSVVFTCLFLALIAELYYLLWWKKRLTSNRSEIESHDYTSPAKELFFMFCWKKHSALNPQVQMISSSTSTTARLQNDNDPPPNDDFLFKPFGESGGHHDLAAESEWLRIQNHYPPRFLFTIIEETKEDLESEDGKSCKSRNTSLSDLLVTLDTPYLTPLASPPFFTPPLTPGGLLPLSNGQITGFNFLFDSASDAEFNSIRSLSSPPPKLRFLQEAEQKLKKKMSKNSNDDKDYLENEATVSSDSSLLKDYEDEDEEEEESFITITVDHKNKPLHDHRSSTFITRSNPH